MKVFIGSLVIFFGTLLAAGLVALGHPGLAAESRQEHFQADPASPASPSTPAGASNAPDWEYLFVIRGLR